MSVDRSYRPVRWRRWARLAGGASRRTRAASWPSHRVAVTLVSAGGMLYAVRGVQQFATLSASSLRWDFAQFHQAAALLNGGRSPYAGIPTGCGTAYCQGGFWYPPLLAEILRPLGALPLVASSIPWLLVINACLLGSLWLAYRLVTEAASADAGLAVVGAALLWFPVYESLGYAQLGAPLLLLILLAARSIQSDTPRIRAAGGASLAVAAALKVSPLIACAAVLAPLRIGGRRRVDRVAAAAMTGAVLLLIAAMLVATRATTEFVTDVMPRLTSTPLSAANISLVAMVRRLALVAGFGIGGSAVTLVVAGAVLLVTLAVAWRVSVRPVDATTARLLTLAALTSAMPLTTSITWTHHLVTDLATLVLMVVCCSGPSAQAVRHRGAVLGVAAAGYILAAMPWGVVQSLLDHLGGLQMPAGAEGLAWIAAAHIGTMGALGIWASALLAMIALRSSAGSPQPG